MTLTTAQVWACIGGLGAMLFVALWVLGHIATSVPHLVVQRDEWERLAKRQSQGAKEWRHRAEQAEQYAAAREHGFEAVPPPAVRDLVNAAGPIARRYSARRGGGVTVGAVESTTGRVPVYRPQADDSTT